MPNASVSRITSLRPSKTGIYEWMSACVNVRLYMHVGMYVCMYVYIYVCTCIRACLFYGWMHISIWVGNLYLWFGPDFLLRLWGFSVRRCSPPVRTHLVTFPYANNWLAYHYFLGSFKTVQNYVKPTCLSTDLVSVYVCSQHMQRPEGNGNLQGRTNILVLYVSHFKHIVTKSE